MRAVIKKIFLFSFLIAGTLAGSIRSANAQLSFYDSLRQMLTYFHTNAINENLRTALERAGSFTSDNTINDSLAVQLKLLISQDMLFNNQKLLSSKVILYGNFLIQVLQHLTPKENRNDITYLNRLGQVYRLLDKEDTALLLFKRTSLIAESQYGKKSLPYAICLYYMAGTCSIKENSQERSFALYQQAMSIIESIAGKKNEWYAKALEKLIWVYRDKLDYEKAHQCISEALAIWEKLTDKDNPDYITHVSDAALFYGYIYDYGAALQLSSEATSMAKEVLGEHHLQYVECLQDLGSAYYDIGYYENAIPCFEMCLSIQEELLGKNHRDNVLTLHNLATTYVRMGAYEKAMPLFENIVNRKSIDPQKREYYAYELNWQAYLYQLLGNYDKALPLYTQALQVTRETIGEETQRYALILKNVACFYQAKTDYPQAVSSLLKVLSIIKKVEGEHAPEYAIALNSLAELYKEMNKCDSALPLFTKALAIRKNKLGEAHPDYAASLNNLGELYMQQGAYDRAFNLFTQSLAIRKKVLGEMHPDYITTLNDLGLLYLSTGNTATASDMLIKANNLELKHILNTYTSLSEEEKLAMINKEFYQFSYLPSLLMKTHITQSNITQQIYTNELLLKGMVLNDQQYIVKNIRASGDEQILQLYYQWRSNKSVIGKELLLPLKQRLSNLDSLQQSTNELEQELSRRSAAFNNHQSAQRISTTNISQKMSTGEASVEFTKFKLYNKRWTDSTMYAALVLLPGDSIPKFIPLCEEQQLLHFVKSSENAIYKKYSYNIVDKKQSKSVNNSLYSLIWKPLEPYLNDIHTIYYAPIGLLNRVAFAALPYDETHCLIDKYQLNQLLSTRSVAAPLQDIKPTDLNVWGNIQYDYPNNATKEDDLVAKRGTGTALSYFNPYLAERSGHIIKAWSELPGTREEVDSIGSLCRQAKLNITIVSDTAATEEVFKALDRRSPQIIHMATHGFFLPAPEQALVNGSNTNAFAIQKDAMFRSGLVLAGGNRTWQGEAVVSGREDGILTAYEIARMDLSNTDLVVLSACETADGDINSSEGVIGLQRAFKLAGVKQIIMSLWDVPDKQTAELMTSFYRYWIAGYAIREAFRMAQLNMKAKYPPRYWAGFVLVE